MDRNTTVFKRDKNDWEWQRYKWRNRRMCKKRQTRKIEGRNYLLDTEMQRYRKRDQESERKRMGENTWLHFDLEGFWPGVKICTLKLWPTLFVFNFIDI